VVLQTFVCRARVSAHEHNEFRPSVETFIRDLTYFHPFDHDFLCDFSQLLLHLYCTLRRVHAPMAFFLTPCTRATDTTQSSDHKFRYDADVFRVCHLTPVVHDPMATALIFVSGRKSTLSVWYYLHDVRSANISCSVHALVIVRTGTITEMTVSCHSILKLSSGKFRNFVK